MLTVACAALLLAESKHVITPSGHAGQDDKCKEEWYSNYSVHKKWGEFERRSKFCFWEIIRVHDYEQSRCKKKQNMAILWWKSFYSLYIQPQCLEVSKHHKQGKQIGCRLSNHSSIFTLHLRGKLDSAINQQCLLLQDGWFETDESSYESHWLKQLLWMALEWIWSLILKYILSFVSVRQQNL